MKNAVIPLIIMMFVFTGLGMSQQVVNLTDQEKQAFLQVHNDIRKQVGSPALQWSEKLENYAKNWALMMAKTKRFQHSPGGQYGENIYKSTFKPTAKDVVNSWASESKYYHGEAVSLDNYWIFGHYTQIIWSSTTEVGCAMAKDADGTYYVVCEYFPPGNVIGKKPTDK